MFENEQTLQGSPSIRLDTRLGTAIKNEVEPPLSPLHILRAKALRAKLGFGLIHRKDPAPYNCFGMALAVRRTSILENAEILKILDDDSYRRTSEQDVRCGDMVLFTSRICGYIHVSVVTRRDPDSGILFVLSKWNSFSGEDEHSVHMRWWLPLGFEDGEIETEYWTDR